MSKKDRENIRSAFLRNKMWQMAPFVLCLAVVVPLWAYHSEYYRRRPENNPEHYTRLRQDQSEINDLSRFVIGPSKVHGNGLMAAVPIKKGETAGLHWFEYETDTARCEQCLQRGLAFYPPQCMVLPGEESSIREGKNGSSSPTQHLPADDMLGCFPRAVNHECEGSCELHVVDSATLRCSDRIGAYYAINQTDCIPDLVARTVPRKPGSKIRSVYLRAKRDLAVGDEITYNYLSAPDYVSKELHVVAGCDL